ncbi:hypothetical protein F5Y14DRAFT_449553 [Nemania sp. NC0429]|nr:hypothetical protein F5Y14DRAFT_449553 [Nemania sp. NC0429]
MPSSGKSSASPGNQPATPATSATSATPGGPGEWLPYQGEPISATKSLQVRHIDTYRDQDWFVQLATLMEPIDKPQSKLLLKFYFFICDFIPYGLIGNFGHIFGNDVMNFLLCQGEHTISRHKIAKHADFAFCELEKWMAKGKTWREAVQAQGTVKQRKRKASWKAPGLHTPAGLLAVLILAHPDPDSKFRNWVGRLEIDWMIRPRDTLAVTHGFWEGITAANIYDTFAYEEPRIPQFPFLADYTVLFSRFEACQRDIRPFVQDWARHISLNGHSIAVKPIDASSYITSHNAKPSPVGSHTAKPSPVGSHTTDPDGAGSHTAKPSMADSHTTIAESHTTKPSGAGSHNTNLGGTGGGAAGDGDSLRVLLAFCSESGDQQQWLINILLHNKDSQVLSHWCYYWQGRIDAVKNLQEQVIIRSLFQQSLHRLKNLYSNTSVAEAYMLLDKADESLDAPIQDPDEFFQNIQDIDICQEWLQARASLRAVASSTGISHTKDIEKRLTAYQACFVYDLMRLSPFHDRWRNVLAFDIKRIRIALEDAQRPPIDQRWWQDSTSLFEKETIRVLKLTNWQLVLLLSGSHNPFTDVLTAVQAHVFRQKLIPEAQDMADSFIFTPKPVIPDRLSNDAIHSQYGSLYKLFGQVEEVRFLTPVPPTPTEAEGSQSQRSSHEPSPPSKRRKRNVFAGRTHVPVHNPSQPAHTLKLLTKADFCEGVASLHNVLELQKQAFENVTSELLAAIKRDVGHTIQIAFQEHLTSLKEDLEQSIHQKIQNEITKWKQSIAETQVPLSEKEYSSFSLNSPALSGNQRDYDAQLLRAAWFYINALGNPEGGVCADEEMLELTKTRFPSLEEDHIVAALQHVHQQAYHCPLQ